MALKINDPAIKGIIKENNYANSTEQILQKNAQSLNEVFYKRNQQAVVMEQIQSALDNNEQGKVVDELMKRNMGDMVHSVFPNVASQAVVDNFDNFALENFGYKINNSWAQEWAENYASWNDSTKASLSTLLSKTFSVIGNQNLANKYQKIAEESSYKAFQKQKRFDDYGLIGNMTIQYAPLTAQLAQQMVKQNFTYLSSGSVLGVAEKTASNISKKANLIYMALNDAGGYISEHQNDLDKNGNKITDFKLLASGLGNGLMTYIIEGKTDEFVDPIVRSLGSATNVSKTSIIKELKKVVKNSIATNVIYEVGSFAFEQAGQGLQEGIEQIGSSLIAELMKYISNKYDGTQFEFRSAKDIFNDGWEEFKDSTVGFSVGGLPTWILSHIAGGRIGTSNDHISNYQAKVREDANQYFSGNGIDVPLEKVRPVGDIVAQETESTAEQTESTKQEAINVKYEKDGSYTPISSEDSQKLENMRADGVLGVRVNIVNPQDITGNNAENLVETSERNTFDANDILTSSEVNTLGAKGSTIYFENAEQMEAGKNILQATKLNVSKNGEGYVVYGVNPQSNKTYSYNLKVATDAEKSSLTNVDYELYKKYKEAFSELSDNVSYIGAQLTGIAKEVTGRDAIDLMNEGLITLNFADKDSVNAYKESNRKAVESEAERLGISFEDAQINGWMDTTTKDGKKVYTINLSNTANERTIAHEVFHVIRAFSTAEQLSGFAGLAGFTGDIGSMWSSDIKEVDGKFELGGKTYNTYSEAFNQIVGNEEKFVDMLLEYVQNGHTPNAKVQSIFDKVLDFMKKIGAKFADKISPEAKQAFDKYFSTKGGESTGATGTSFEITDRQYELLKEDLQSNPNNWDGTNWLAPNGKVSNLTEKQYLQVRTAQFKEWFGDWENDPANSSKVLDENGEPLVVYHGTRNGKFEVFDKSKVGERWDSDTIGFFFSESKLIAEDYLNDYSDVGAFDNGEPNLFEVFLDIKNPLNVNKKWALNNYGRTSVLTNEDAISFWDSNQQDIISSINESDGIIVDTENKYPKMYVAIESNQIKSATENNGDFSRANDSILFSISSYSKETQDKIKKYTDESQYVDGIVDGNVYVHKERLPQDNSSSVIKQTFQQEFIMARNLSNEIHSKVYLIPESNGKNFMYVEKHSNPDSIVRGIFIEFKQSEYGTYSSVNSLLRKASKQADGMYLHLNKGEINESTLKALKGRVASSNIQDGFMIFLSDNAGDFREYIIINKALVKSALFSGPRASSQSTDSIAQESVNVNTQRDLFQITSKEEDEAYFRALKDNDLERALELVKTKAKTKGYTTDYEYRGYHTAPNRNGLTESERRKIVKEGSDVVSVSINDIAEGYSPVPESMFTQWERDGWHWKSAKKFNSIIKKIRNTSDSNGKTSPVEVTVYRAIPKSIKETGLRNGDWVALTYDYAQEHADAHNEPYKVISQTVSSSDLFWDGNDINEFGYDDGNDYVYQNTKNNVKSANVITYDENGDIIPLSKRFNKFNSSPLFEITSNENYFANENVKREIEYAVGNGFYVRPEYVEHYKGEAWADRYLEKVNLQKDKSELFTEAKKYRTYEEWHDTIVANMDFFDEITPEQEAEYQKIYELAQGSDEMLPEDKDAKFVEYHTSTDQQMLDLAKILSKYKDATWISSTRRRNNGRFGITAKWGTFKGVSTTVKRLYSSTKQEAPSAEKIAEARAIVQANPRPYRKAFEQAEVAILRANAVYDNFGNSDAIRQSINDINTAYDLEHTDERIEADLQQISMKNEDAPIIKQDVTAPVQVVEEKPAPEVASITEQTEPVVDGYTFINVSETFNNKRKDVLDKYKPQIQQAVEAGEYINSDYLKVYDNEDWARNELDIRQYISEHPEVRENVLSSIENSEEFDFNTWLDEQGLSDVDEDIKNFYFDVFNRITLLSPEQADKAFATEWTSSREKMIELAGALSNFSKTSKNSETRFGGIKGINLNAVLINKNSTEAEVNKAIGIIQKNPRPYRLAYQEAYNDYTNTSYGKKETRDKALIGLNSTLDAQFETIADEEDDALVKQQRNSYSATIEDIDAEIQQSNSVLKALGLDGADAKEINDKLSEIMANADKRNITEKNKYKTALEAIQTKNRLQAEKNKRIATMEAIKKEAKFSETSTDVSFVPLFNWINSIFAVDGNRKELRAKVEQINKQLRTTTDKNTINSLQAEKRALLDQINESSVLVVPQEAKVFFDDAMLQKMDNRQSKWTQEELDDLLNRVEMVRRVAMQKYSSKKQAEMNRRMNFVAGIVQDATGVNLQDIVLGPVSARDVRDFASTIDTSENKGLVFSGANLALIKNGRLARAIAGGKEGSYYQISQREAYQHQSEQRRMELTRKKALANKLEELNLDPVQLSKKATEYTKRNSREKVELTKAEMIGVYVYSQSTLGEEKLTSDWGNQMNKEDMFSIINQLTAEEKAFGDFLIEDMSNRYPEMKRVYETLYNRVLGKRVNYFPLIALDKYISDTDEFDLLCGVNVENLSKTIDKSQTKSINPNAKYALNLDVVNSWASQMQKQEHFIAFAEWSRDMGYILNRGGAGEVIANKFGVKTREVIQNYVDFLSTQNQSSVDKDLIKIVRRIASAKIIGNPSSTLKQSGALGGMLNSNATVQEMFSAMFGKNASILDFIRANDLLGNSNIATDSWLEFMYSLAPELESRGIDMDINKAFESLNQNGFQRGIRKIGEITSKPMEWADNYVVHAVWTASFLSEFRELQNTMDIESAIREAGFRASQTVAETQNTTERMDMSNMQRLAQASLWRQLATSFQSQAINIYNEFWIDMPTAFRNKEGKKAIRILGGLIFNAGMMLAIGGAFWKRDDEDEEEQKKRLGQDLFVELVQNLAPVVGNLWWNNYEGYDSDILTGSISSVNTVIKNIINVAQGEGDATKLLENALKVFGDVSGFGSVPFTRVIKMIEEDWNVGYLINSDWGHIVENNR